MHAEMAQHQRLDTLELIDLPIKVNSAGVIVKYKARLVARGFPQIEGED